ncbi:MAG: LysM peptidoglycan-binding domain-containing protein [Treponema sp.]|nr:LysM peptidoglycan-binding domain-containing protein [Spirochaetia bacterium]MDY2841014.1 LysM peptidoglycan-binding domain-containing protein [Treponema sp.]
MRKYIFALSILLALSSLCAADTYYSVEKGDTLYSISKKYQLTVAELRTANNMSENDVLKIGQKLTIPEADIGTAAALSTNTASKNKTASSSAVKTSTYTVEKGDTLYGIARKNGISLADLLNINGFDSNTVLKIGQKIKIYQKNEEIKKVSEKKTDSPVKSNTSTVTVPAKTPDTRSYGATLTSDSSTKWPVKNPKVTQVKGKVSGVQLSAKQNESVLCIHEGTVMYVGIYRGFGQVVFIQSKTGLIYAYTGLGSVDVKKGDYIVSGKTIGTAGIDSISGNSQITFMVFQNGQPIDPAKAPRN